MSFLPSLGRRAGAHGAWLVPLLLASASPSACGSDGNGAFDAKGGEREDTRDEDTRDEDTRDEPAPDGDATPGGGRNPGPQRDAGTTTRRDAGATLPGLPTRDAGAAKPDPSEGDEAPPPASKGKSCLQGTSNDYKQNGPYQVRQKDVTIEGLGAYTIFFPANMDAECGHPFVAWGNGTGVAGSAIYAHWQRHAASWGIVVIASHSASAAAGRILEGALDYLLKENENAGSDFAGKLSDRAGVAGHSQGGIAATAAARHPNVKAEVCVQGGGFPPPNVAFMCQTGTGDFLRGMCTSAFNSAKGPSFLADLQGADHISTPTLLGAVTPQGAEFVRTYTAWFRCHLGEDANACKLFTGETPAVCGQGGATYVSCKSKNNP